MGSYYGSAGDGNIKTPNPAESGIEADFVRNLTGSASVISLLLQAASNLL
jgi:hypothetical protein